MMLITPARKQLTWATRDIGNIVLSKQSFAENYWHGDTVKVARDKRGEGLEEAQVGEGGGGESFTSGRWREGSDDFSLMAAFTWPL